MLLAKLMCLYEVQGLGLKTILLSTVTTGYYCNWTTPRIPVCSIYKTHSGLKDFVWKERIENTKIMLFEIK